jgi:hypothetical protein
MSNPKYEPEIVRAKVAEATGELRDRLRRALKYALAPEVDESSG